MTCTYFKTIIRAIPIVLAILHTAAPSVAAFSPSSRTAGKDCVTNYNFSSSNSATPILPIHTRIFNKQKYHSKLKLKLSTNDRGSHEIEEENGESSVKKMNNFLSRSILIPFLLTSSIFLSYPLAPASAFDPNIFTNDYNDPQHPLCKRRIEVSTDGKSFQYTGTATIGEEVIGRGCSPAEAKEFGIREGGFAGEILEPGNKLGVMIYQGVWEPAGSASTSLGYEDVDGIRWMDGNKWIVKDQKRTPPFAAQLLTYSYLGLSIFAGAYGVINTNLKKDSA